jgi:hypothetical protein
VVSQLLGVLCSITNRLSALVSSGKLCRETSSDGTTYYYSPSLHRAESDVAHIVADLMRTSSHTSVPESTWLSALPAVIRHVLSTVKPGAVLDVAGDDALAVETLSPEQVLLPSCVPGCHSCSVYSLWTVSCKMEAITMAMRHPVSILTGGPGTGKTFAVRVAVELWRKQGKRVLLAAPTGRAAARMNEMFAGDAKATTVHKLLECGVGGSGGGDEGDVMAEDELWSWSFRRNERSPVEADGTFPLGCRCIFWAFAPRFVLLLVLSLQC